MGGTDQLVPGIPCEKERKDKDQDADNKYNERDCLKDTVALIDPQDLLLDKRPQHLTCQTGNRTHFLQRFFTDGDRYRIVRHILLDLFHIGTERIHGSSCDQNLRTAASLHIAIHLVIYALDRVVYAAVLEGVSTRDHGPCLFRDLFFHDRPQGGDPADGIR